jgi:hypothetical protein
LTAGAGSVLSLYGESGDVVVSLKQLKTPAGDFYPRRVLLDKEHGQMSLYEDVTVESILARAGRSGKSARWLATELFGTDKPKDTQVESVRNKLKRMVKNGQAEEFVSPVDGKQMYRVPTSQRKPQRRPNALPTPSPTSPTSEAKAQVKGSNAGPNVPNETPTPRGGLITPDVGAVTSADADGVGGALESVECPWCGSEHVFGECPGHEQGNAA